MSPVALIGTTASVTFAATVPLGLAAISWWLRQPPATPTIAAPTAITVRLVSGRHPVWDCEIPVLPPTAIPKDRWPEVLQLITPDRYFAGGVDDFIMPIVANVQITHEGAERPVY
jgi:hypothetical protein